MALRDKAFTAAASARAKSITQWPLLVVIVGEVIALALIWVGHWRWGAFLLGGSLIVGALERLILPPRLAGLLQVRTRVFDVAALAGMGLVIMALALVVPRLD